MDYDMIIIGGGPAGLSAGLYASRASLKNLILEKSEAGGQIATTSEVDNFPGSMKDATGPMLSQRMKEQCEAFGSEFRKEECKELKKVGDYFQVVTNKDTHQAKAVVAAMGAYPREIGCPGEREFRGMGVSYCATCDGFFFRDLNVAVVGGGDSALEEGIFLTKFAKKVTIIHRRDELRAVKTIQDKAMANPKIEFIFDSVVEEITGDGLVKGVRIKNVKTGVVRDLSVDGVFIYVGYHPNTELIKDMAVLDESGYVVAGEDMETKIPGLFVAGDIRKKSLKQVITAAADGAIAAVQGEKYIAEHFE
jgi:thioredoxin reductase (NADPH)